MSFATGRGERWRRSLQGRGGRRKSEGAAGKEVAGVHGRFLPEDCCRRYTANPTRKEIAGDIPTTGSSRQGGRSSCSPQMMAELVLAASRVWEYDEGDRLRG